MSIPEVILPCPQTSPWFQWWHCHLPHPGLLSVISKVCQLCSNLLSLYPSLISAIKPLTCPRPCSCLVSMIPFFPLIFLLGISHLKTQILLCHFPYSGVLFCLIFSLVSQLSLIGVCFSSTPFSILSYQMHQNVSLCLEHAVPSKLTPALPAAETPPVPTSHPNHLLCLQPQMFPSSVTLVPPLQGTVNMLTLHLKRVDPWEWGHVFCNNVFCVWHTVGTNIAVSEWMNEHRVWPSLALPRGKAPKYSVPAPLLTPPRDLIWTSASVTVSVFQRDRPGDPLVNHLQQPQVL